MPVFQIKVQPQWYSAIVERGALERILQFIPARAGKVFVVSTQDVWQLHGERVRAGLGGLLYDVIFLPGGEERKRLIHVEAAAEHGFAAHLEFLHRPVGIAPGEDEVEEGFARSDRCLQPGPLGLVPSGGFVIRAAARKARSLVTF